MNVSEAELDLIDLRAALGLERRARRIGRGDIEGQQSGESRPNHQSDRDGGNAGPGIHAGISEFRQHRSRRELYSECDFDQRRLSGGEPYRHVDFAVERYL